MLAHLWMADRNDNEATPSPLPLKFLCFSEFIPPDHSIHLFICLFNKLLSQENGGLNWIGLAATS